MMNLFRKLHHIPSIILGLPIFIICLTGCILLFEEDVARLTKPQLYHIENVEGEPLPLSELLDKVSAELNQGEKKNEITSLTLSEGEEPYLVSLKGSRNKIAVNQYTGEVLGERVRSKFFATMFFMHRFLLNKPAKKGEMTVGKMIVGISALAFVIILISGFALWLPKTAAGLKNRLKICFNKGWKRFWYDTHVAGGFYALLLLLLMSLTGLYWSFSWYRNGLVFSFTSPERELMVAETQKAAYTQIKVEGYEGLMVIDPQVKVPQSFHRTIYSLHTGTWGGAFSKWLYFFAVLIGLSLPMTGYWLWLKKKAHKKKKQFA